MCVYVCVEEPQLNSGILRGGQFGSLRLVMRLRRTPVGFQVVFAAVVRGQSQHSMRLDTSNSLALRPPMPSCPDGPQRRADSFENVWVSAN